MILKQYEYIKNEIESKEIILPTEISYYFQLGIRRAIKLIPKFTTWNKEQYNKNEELYEFDIICIYNSYERKAEFFTIKIKDIEHIYYSEKHEFKRLIRALVNNELLVRTKEQFEEDKNELLSLINK